MHGILQQRMLKIINSQLFRVYKSKELQVNSKHDSSKTSYLLIKRNINPVEIINSYKHKDAK